MYYIVSENTYFKELFISWGSGNWTHMLPIILSTAYQAEGIHPKMLLWEWMELNHRPRIFSPLLYPWATPPFCYDGENRTLDHGFIYTSRDPLLCLAELHHNLIFKHKKNPSISRRVCWLCLVWIISLVSYIFKHNSFTRRLHLYINKVNHVHDKIDMFIDK